MEIGWTGRQGKSRGTAPTVLGASCCKRAGMRSGQPRNNRETRRQQGPGSTFSSCENSSRLPRPNISCTRAIVSCRAPGGGSEAVGSQLSSQPALLRQHWQESALDNAAAWPGTLVRRGWGQGTWEAREQQRGAHTSDSRPPAARASVSLSLAMPKSMILNCVGDGKHSKSRLVQQRLECLGALPCPDTRPPVQPPPQHRQANYHDPTHRSPALPPPHPAQAAAASRRRCRCSQALMAARQRRPLPRAPAPRSCSWQGQETRGGSVRTTGLQGGPRVAVHNYREGSRGGAAVQQQGIEGSAGGASHRG